MSLNGTESGDHGTAPRPPLTTTTSIKPAMTVVVVALLTLITFGIIDVATGQSVAPPSTVVVVGGLAIQPHSTVMKGCETDSVIPGNVISAYIVPVHARDDGAADVETSAADAYECSQEITAPYPQSEILGFYLAEYKALGWDAYSQGPSPHGGQEALFDIEGTDTFYWEGGVVINSTSATSTSWTLTFFQNDAID